MGFLEKCRHQVPVGIHFSGNAVFLPLSEKVPAIAASGGCDETCYASMVVDNAAAEPVEVWVRIEKDADGYPKSQDWEDLWAWPLDGGNVRIVSLPFFAKGIAAGDVFTTTQADEGFTMLGSVVDRGGHSTFRIWVSENSSTAPDDVMNALVALGATTELTLDRLIAVDATPTCEPAIWEYLKGGEDRGMWSLQVGHSAD